MCNEHSIIEHGGWDPFTEDYQLKLNELTLRYYLSRDKKEKEILLKQASELVFKCRFWIVNSGQVAEKTKVLGEEAASILLESFTSAVISYNPYIKSKEKVLPFTPFFRVYLNYAISDAYKKKLKQLRSEEGFNTDEEGNIIEPKAYGHESQPDDSITFPYRFAYLWVKFEQHRISNKRLEHYRAFYTGDIIAIAKRTESTEVFDRMIKEKLGRKILSSCLFSFFDYVLIDEITDLYSIYTARLKKHKNLSPVPETPFLEKVVEIPIQNIIFSAFTQTTEANISDQRSDYYELWHKYIGI